MKSLPSQSLYSSRRDRKETSSRDLDVMKVIKKNEVGKRVADVPLWKDLRW